MMLGTCISLSAVRPQVGVVDKLARLRVACSKCCKNIAQQVPCEAREAGVASPVTHNIKSLTTTYQ